MSPSASDDLPIYFDHHATTPVDPRVLKVMLPFFDAGFGNAASRTHAYGWRADDAVEQARAQIASLIGAPRAQQEIIFTSGGTESDNLAIKGACHFYRDQGDHLIVSKAEHKAVLNSAKRLESEGFRVTWLDVDAEGRVDPQAVSDAIEDGTLLVSVMLTNNEVGTVQPIGEIGAITRARGVLLHVDAAQGLGYVPASVVDDQIDLMTVVSHKMYGPKGMGALYIRRDQERKVRLMAELDGGGHERGYRSGTLNVPAIVGFGAAAEIMRLEGAEEATRIAALRDDLYARLADGLSDLILNGAPLKSGHRHPGNLNLSFEYADGEGLVLALQKHMAISSGSACSSAGADPSYVLRAMGRSKELSDASVRFGLGRHSTAAEVEKVARTVVSKVSKLRELNEVWRLKQQGVDPESFGW